MESALIQTILRVGVPALVSLADMFIELARTQDMKQPSIEDLRARRDQIRDLSDLATYEAQEKDPDQ